MDFWQIATNFGVAFACLVALSVVVWRSIVWFGTHIAKPVADRHIRFLDELSTATASQSQALQTMAIQQGKNLEGIERIMRHMEDMVEKQDELHRVLIREAKSQKGSL